MRGFWVFLALGFLGCKTETAPSRAAQSEDVLYDIAPIAVEVPVGSEVAVPIVIEARPGFKVNKEFPWRFVLDSTPPLTAMSTEIATEDIELGELKAIAQARVKANQAGVHSGVVTANFSICNDDVCKFYRNEKIGYHVTAK